MQTLFETGSETDLTNDHCLLLEIGQDYCQYAYWHRLTNSIQASKFISFTEVEADTVWPGIIDELKQQPAEQVMVSVALPQALLVPSKYFTNKFEALDAVYNQPAQVYKADRINEWQMVTMYSLPEEIHHRLTATFSLLQFFHAYTTCIKVYNGFVADNQLAVHFTPQHFRVLLKKDSAIQLAQTYSYQTPLDVVYYLLKICYEFEIEQPSVHLILSGLIDKASNLFNELQQYFTNIHFAQPADFKLPNDSLPHYFFTSLYNLATCASSVEV